MWRAPTDNDKGIHMYICINDTTIYVCIHQYICIKNYIEMCLECLLMAYTYKVFVYTYDNDTTICMCMYQHQYMYMNNYIN